MEKFACIVNMCKDSTLFLDEFLCSSILRTKMIYVKVHLYVTIGWLTGERYEGNRYIQYRYL